MSRTRENHDGRGECHWCVHVCVRVYLYVCLCDIYRVGMLGWTAMTKVHHFLALPLPAVSEALPLLTEAVLGFRRCGSVVDLRNALPLLAGCHGNLGHSKEQDSVLMELSELVLT